MGRQGKHRPVGHVRKNCPNRGLAGPKESRGKSSGQSQVATIVSTGVHAEGIMDTVAVEVDPVDEAIGGLMCTMHDVDSGERQQRLGSTIWAEVQFEGTLVRTLVDTSSPATIVGLRFVLEVLAVQWDTGQSPPEWASYFRGRMQQPITILQNYSGGKLSIVRQMTAKLNKGDEKLHTVVDIQDGAPVDLLLCTDIPHSGVLSSRARDRWSTA